jgi:integrase
MIPHFEKTWQMPIRPESYDQSPLTERERWALEQSVIHAGSTARSRFRGSYFKQAQRLLARLNQPIADVFYLRRSSHTIKHLMTVQFAMHQAMYQCGKIFWEWSTGKWMEVLCPNPTLFEEKHGKWKNIRTTLMDVAYLLGGITDLRAAGMTQEVVEFASVYFGRERVHEQCQRLFGALTGVGYGDGKQSFSYLLHGLSLLFILQRSPFLEDISEDILDELSKESLKYRRQAMIKVRLALHHLKILPLREEVEISDRFSLSSAGMAKEWYEWCQTWHERAVDLTPHVRRHYAGDILAIGRWLHERAPEIRTPEQWTEDLALHFRSDLCFWTYGQYAGDIARRRLEARGLLGKPLQACGIVAHLASIRRFLTDLTRKPHAVKGESARRISLDFVPNEVLTVPDHIKRAIDRVNPRDIDLRVWAKLAIAAATLSQGDLPQGTRYPLSLQRALGLLWVTSARRPNEIARLRLDCLREDWDPEMQSDEPIVIAHPNAQQAPEEGEKGPPKIYYLYVPTGKNRGPFWIWIPDYTANAIIIWKQERPLQQQKQRDWKTGEEVDLLFCYRDRKVAQDFLNESLIPTLCAKAGVDTEDARGRITGHRGRSTRLTLLRNNGVSLDDLAEYAGHADSRTIRAYARQNPIQLHRRIRKADDVSRVIEGVIDMEAAAQGLPALRWFIGYETDGEPMYCGNQIYVTCPHRLECAKCGMFIGGERARLLHEGENTLPIESKVPMTPIEKCVIAGDEAGAEACRAELRQIPPPEAPDLSVIFNPEGLSNHELEQLAQLATTEALNKLGRALEAHEKRLAETQQHKTGRSALVGSQRKRIRFIQELITDCEQRRDGSRNDPGLQAQ